MHLYDKIKTFSTPQKYKERDERKCIVCRHMKRKYDISDIERIEQYIIHEFPHFLNGNLTIKLDSSIMKFQKNCEWSGSFIAIVKYVQMLNKCRISVMISELYSELYRNRF